MVIICFMMRWGRRIMWFFLVRGGWLFSLVFRKEVVIIKIIRVKLMLKRLMKVKNWCCFSILIVNLK